MELSCGLELYLPATLRSLSCDPTWLQRRRPKACSCCEGSGESECQWCHGTGRATLTAMILQQLLEALHGRRLSNPAVVSQLEVAKVIKS